MGELTDKTKGKTKEIAGVASGDRKLEAEGKADQTRGKLKERFEDAKRAIKERLRSNPSTRR